MNQHEEMDGFERSLQRAMRRGDAPDTLEVFLMGTVVAERPAKTIALTYYVCRWRAIFGNSRGKLWEGALALSVLAASILSIGIHRDHANERTKADRDFALSQEITDQAFVDARNEIQANGIALDEGER